MFEQLYSYENLLASFEKAKQGKTQKHYVMKFKKDLEINLKKLQEELKSQTYKPRPLKTFIIRDPKTRKISKSKFRDRVIHHALINIIKPLFQKSFIYDSHANQIGKGTMKAIERFDYFKRKVSMNNTRACYVLKADIKHYFEEVNHDILISIIEKKVLDKKVLWLIKEILNNIASANFGKQRERERELILKGMPLGSHTSQFFANIYLNELDQYVKHILKAKFYIRYVDDFVILSNSRKELEEWKIKINEFLNDKLKLQLHQDKSQVVSLERGITFLGFRIFYHNKLIRMSNLRKFENKLKGLRLLYRERQTRREKVIEFLEGWMAYAKHADTYKYSREMLRHFNKNFPIFHKNQIIRSKRIRNFYRKVYSSKVEFSSQKTLQLMRKGLSIEQIAIERGIKEPTVWGHFANLIEHGQLAVWNVMPKNKIVLILKKIKDSSETLSQIRKKIPGKGITFNEIACAKAHTIMKDKIKRNNLQRKALSLR